MKPIRFAMRVCKKGMHGYWTWLVKMSEDLGEYYQPW
jgi:hypothetical protein